MENANCNDNCNDNDIQSEEEHNRDSNYELSSIEINVSMSTMHEIC